ncbi:hypothetical protein EMIHUDRAFT_467758 [Emiliania huxleyi CCMP1516]|uniref:GHMP kinase N-terminal domain-containing protein n=2 Tax=Emiliania huxleyi TaxID=2903 RepID=A0A0D3KCS9_EMIH1|nr:hypothetical protein EMIHUDRAFT_467758 [Emiliania huxleyi CCMP1516]EOD33564.1 hypothetical protein EMIHUDRAFT_467758 [Emiliania huxleyi CCMP1516]|eukprot:XP_005785993.1 hypothetical protein EMIHUDRAFT_467758 [Emiliania huxleyi CCMP1516]
MAFSAIEDLEEYMASERTVELFVPGRICLMGEHSDWAGSYRRFNSSLLPGMCLVSGTNQGLYARACRHPSKLIVTSIDQGGNVCGPTEFSMDPQALLAAAATGDHFSYVAGVAYQILVRCHVSGLVLHNYKTDLPARKGLSSSAAACVLAARAFNRVYDLKLTVRGEMDLGYHGEITTPSQCGRMDQCCAFGPRPVLMTFDGDRLDCEELSLKSTLHLVIVELDGTKDTTDTTVILQRLTKCYPVPDDDAQRGVHRCVHELLGAINQRIVRAAMAALDCGDMAALGALMDEAQEHFDRLATPLCPSQLTAPNLHRVLRHEPLRKHIFGAKGVGSQGDGCAQLLCRSATDAEAAMRIVETELGMRTMPLQIGASRPVGQAVVPAASFSAASFPASRTTPPALFPLLDADGILKPAILLLVEQAVDARLAKVVIVVSPEHKGHFEALFTPPRHTSSSHLLMARLPPRLQRYAEKIREVGAKVELAPTLLLLGDHLYTTAHPEGTSCVRQLLAAYTGTSVMALQRTAEAQPAPAQFLPASSPPPRSLLGTFPAGSRAPAFLETVNALAPSLEPVLPSEVRGLSRGRSSGGA